MTAQFTTQHMYICMHFQAITKRFLSTWTKHCTNFQIIKKNQDIFVFLAYKLKHFSGCLSLFSLSLLHGQNNIIQHKSIQLKVKGELSLAVCTHTHTHKSCSSQGDQKNNSMTKNYFSKLKHAQKITYSTSKAHICRTLLLSFFLKMYVPIMLNISFKTDSSNKKYRAL